MANSLVFDCIASASGTNSIGISVTGNMDILYTIASATTDISVDGSGTANVYACQYDTHAGLITSLSGDRSAWDTLIYYDRHAKDINDHTYTYHSNPANPPLGSYLGSGSFFVGNGSNQAVGVTMSGDATLNNAGVLTIAPLAVDGSNIAVNNGSIFIGGADGAAHEQTISGDASISNAGALTLTTVNATPGTYGDDTHLAQITVDEKGRITAIGSIVFNATGEVLMADGITPPDPLTTDDETDWLYEG